MFFVPAWDPQDFLKAGADGTNTSELWLQTVGMTIYAIGAFVSLTTAGERLRHAIATFDPVIAVFDPADVRWCLPASVFALPEIEEAEPAYAAA